MDNKKQSSNEILVRTNLCCEGFLQNQIGFIQAVRNALEKHDKEEVICHLDKILEYYKSKLAELPSVKNSSNR